MSVITIHIGGFGIKMAESFYESATNNYSISLNGKSINQNSEQEIHFIQGSDEKFRPRAVFADIGVEDLNQTQNFKFKDLWNKNRFTNFRGDGTTFAVGHYTNGAEIVSDVVEKVTNEIKNCDKVGAILMFNSLNGGTGGGLGTLVESKLLEDFQDLNLISYNIIGDNKVSTSALETYNDLLSLSQ